MNASVVITYTKAGAEQDIILNSQLPDIASLGLSTNCRLQVITEFIQPPQPNVTAATLPTAAGSLEDDSISFGMMHMIRGRAFLFGTNSPPASVAKHWLTLNGRQFLVEEVPLVSIAQAIDTLPPFTAQSGLGKAVVSKNWIPSPRRMVQVASKARFLAQATPPSQGLVLDYPITFSDNGGNYVFQGDSTYYISGAWYEFSGTFTFEGGAVLKYAQGASLNLIGGPQIHWQGSAYRPVFFTAKDDNSVGEPIPGSTGNPGNNRYANPALTIGAVPTYSIDGVRIMYAQLGLNIFGYGGKVADAQFVNCQQDISAANTGTPLWVENALFSGAQTVFSSLYGETLQVQNSTIANCTCLESGQTSGMNYNTLNLINCILANVSTYCGSGSNYDLFLGDHNGFYLGTPFGTGFFTCSDNPFQTAGGGNYYLNNDSNGGVKFQNVGSSSIDTTLLNSLKAKTTQAPTLLTNCLFSGSLNQVVRRDVGTQPDLGYHYDSLDYLISQVTVQFGQLSLNGGVALGLFGGTAFNLAGGQVNSTGMPQTLNRLADCVMVQEQPIVLGGSPLTTIFNATYGPINSVQARFTDISVRFNGPSGYCFLYSSGGTYPVLQFQFQDCWLRGATWDVAPTTMTTYQTTVTLWNNLFDRSSVTFMDLGQPQGNPPSSMTFSLQNNLFHGGLLLLDYDNAGNTWASFQSCPVYDNAFDNCGVYASGNLTADIHNGYNGYVNTAQLPGAGTGNVPLQTFSYATGPFGSYYQQSTGFINGGHTTADQVGLFHYTTQMISQAPEGSKPSGTHVDIGFHYVATSGSTSTQPLDSDVDGLPDYVEDSNGNGVYDQGIDPSDWQNPFTDGSGMDDGWEVKYFGQINIDPYADPDGDGYVNLEEYQNGTDPTVFNSPPKNVSTIQVLHDQANPANIGVTWNSVPNATSYTITRTIGTTVTTYTVSGGGTTSWPDTNVPPGSSPTYTVTPNYAGGGNPAPSPSGNADYNPQLAINAIVVRGPTPSDPSLTPLQIVLGGRVPTSVSTIRVHKFAAPLYYSYQFNFGSYGQWAYVLDYGDLGWSASPVNPPPYDGYFDVPINQFVNGVYQIPVSQAPEWCAYYFETQPIGSDNRGGVTNYAVFARNVPFLDGSAVLKDNLRFILRAGQTGDPNAADIALIDFQANNNYAAVSPYVEHANVGQNFLTEVAAFNENWFMRNWAYDTGFASFDIFGPSYYFFWWDKDIAQALYQPPPYIGVYGVDPAGGRGAPFVKYQFDGFSFVNSGGNAGMLNSQLTGNPPIYLGYEVPAFIAQGYNFWPADYAGLSWDNVNQQTDLASGYANYFGLPYQSMRVTDSLNPLNQQDDIPAGGAYSDPDPYYYSEYFQNVTPPTLTTASSADYYFTQIGDLTSPYAATIYPKPNDPGFSVNQTTPLLITAVGQEAGVLGWAKQHISNGASGKYGYLGQYFDPTSVQGQGAILSEYGDFFAMQPGQFTLKTKADSDQGGMQGYCTVYAISLNVDANHDGNMDRTYGGPDTTSANQPMEFWINNDNDGTGVGQDSPLLKTTQPDSAYNQIRSERDLEDFARLWISGVPSLVTGNYQITLHWRNYTGNPAIKLYLDQLAGGGISYLTDPNMAQNIVDNPYSEFLYCTVSAGTDFVFPDPGFFGGSTKQFLFEGISPGRGELVLTISQNGNTIAETSVWLDLHDVKDFYERAVIADNTSGAISTWSSTINSIQPALASGLESDQNLIVFVHGINVKNVDWLIDSDTVFKRLYWSGFKGKFATVDWPCNFFDWSLLQNQTSVFNQSEIKAYKAGTALTSYLSRLRAEFPGYRLHLFVHSQGNAVVSEAIAQGVPFDTYILTQGAMPDSSYDINAPTDPTLTTAESIYPTPEGQPMGYRGIYANFAGRIVNFYNPFDPVLSLWIADQAGLKPDGYAQNFVFPIPVPSAYYTFDGVNGWHHRISGFVDYQVTDPQESRAMISRSLTDPIGRSQPETAHGVIQSGWDLNQHYGFYNSFPGDHSAQWVWPIQTTRPYFQQVLISCQIQPAP